MSLWIGFWDLFKIFKFVASFNFVLALRLWFVIWPSLTTTQNTAMIRRSQLVRWYQPTAESYVCLTSAEQTSDRRKNIASAHAHCAGYEGQKTLWLGLHGLLRDVRETFPRQVADVSEKSPTSRRRQQLVSRKTHTTPKLFRDKTGQPPRGGRS